MRNYKQKMNKYRLPKDRYRELKFFCCSADNEKFEVIDAAIRAVFGTVNDPLAYYIQLDMTEDYNWAKLEVMQIPCSRDTFRLYRAKVYYMLDKILTGREEMCNEKLSS